MEIPEGYVLIPKDLYDSLMEGQQGNSRDVGKEEEIEEGLLKLRVLREFYLGDCRVRLRKGELVYFKDNEYIRVRGQKYTTLDSFYTLWFRQNRNDSAFPPVFEVVDGNVESTYVSLPTEEEELARIKKEERAGYNPTPSDVQDALVREIQKQNENQKKVREEEKKELGVDDFEVKTVVRDKESSVVSKIPGPPAKENPEIEVKGG